MGWAGVEQDQQALCCVDNYRKYSAILVNMKCMQEKYRHRIEDPRECESIVLTINLNFLILLRTDIYRDYSSALIVIKLIGKLVLRERKLTDFYNRKV